MCVLSFTVWGVSAGSVSRIAIRMYVERVGRSCVLKVFAPIVVRWTSDVFSSQITRIRIEKKWKYLETVLDLPCADWGWVFEAFPLLWWGRWRAIWRKTEAERTQKPPKAHTETNASRQEKLFVEIQNTFLILWMSASGQYIPPKNEYILQGRLDIYCICPWIYTSPAK